MIFCGIRRKFYKFHGKQQNAMANLETGWAVYLQSNWTLLNLNILTKRKSCCMLIVRLLRRNPSPHNLEKVRRTSPLAVMFLWPLPKHCLRQQKLYNFLQPSGNFAIGSPETRLAKCRQISIFAMPLAFTGKYREILANNGKYWQIWFTTLHI